MKGKKTGKQEISQSNFMEKFEFRYFSVFAKKFVSKSDIVLNTIE